MGTPEGLRLRASVARDLGSLATFLGQVARAARLPPVLAPGAVLGGHYRITGLLGAGGMGVVYLAHDTSLDRPVAIKLCRAGAADADERLHREAIALAQLHHPNVVTVHEVGKSKRSVFLVMDHVAGGTLRDWLGTPRPEVEILDHFVAVGEALVAAHEAGIVHRDVKPENVLIDASGNPRLTDFGLAYALVEVGAEGEGGAADRATMAAGTPEYMAPEQRAFGVVDARADQYAFCVSLWEALTGELPGGGAAGKPIAAPLAAALRRGIAPAPADRFPTMRALLDAIGAVRWRQRRRRTRAIAAAVAALAAAAVVVTVLLVRRAPAAVVPSCTELAGDIAAEWSPRRAADLGAALRSTNRAFAGAVADTLQRHLDAWSHDWSTTYTTACADADGWGRDIRDRALACLDGRRRDLGAFLGVLAADPAGSVEHALDGFARLEAPSRCLDHERLLAAMPAPDDPAFAAAVADIRAALAHIWALADGRDREAHGQATALLVRAEELGYQPVIAQTLAALAHLELRVGTAKEGRRRYEEAFFVARSSGMFDTAVDAAGFLAYLAAERSDFAGAAQWERHGVAALTEDVNADAEPCLLERLAAVRDLQGKPEEAIEMLERGIELARGLTPGADRCLGRLGATLGTLLDAAGRYPEAVAVLEKVVATWAEAYGPDHPGGLFMLGNLGLALSHAGREAEAIDVQQRAVTMARREASNHIDLGFALLNLGVAYNLADRDADARPVLEEALAIVEQVSDPDELDSALVANTLGITLQELGDLDGARRHLLHALAIDEKLLGTDHPDTATVLGNLGSIAHDARDFHAAVTYYRRAIEIWDRIDPDHPYAAYALLGLGQTLSLTIDRRAALEALERAHALRIASGAGDRELAQTAAALGKTLHERGPPADKRRGVALVADGVTRYRRAGADALAAELEAWLTTHKPPR